MRVFDVVNIVFDDHGDFGESDEGDGILIGRERGKKREQFFIKYGCEERSFTEEEFAEISSAATHLLKKERITTQNEKTDQTTVSKSEG